MWLSSSHSDRETSTVSIPNRTDFFRIHHPVLQIAHRSFARNQHKLAIECFWFRGAGVLQACASVKINGEYFIAMSGEPRGVLPCSVVNARCYQNDRWP